MNQIIHAAVRRDLARTEQALRSFPDGDRPRAVQIQRAWSNLVRELTHHHEAEDTHVWPFLQAHGADTELLATMESEHVAMKVTLEAAADSLDGLVASPTAARASAAADLVARCGAATEAHLDHEERDVEPLLASLVDTEEWKPVAKKLRPSKPSDMGSSLAWMQDGAGERELTSLRATIPGPVLTVLSGVLGRRYRREVAPAWHA